ncbi:MAG: DNA polymerase domain-containing protein [Nitrososphaeria archaeon]
MRNEIGWILDAYIEDGNAVFWIKTVDGITFKVKDKYSPNFYILPKSLEDGERILQTLAEYPNVANVCWTEKFTNLKSKEKSRLLHIKLDKLSIYKKLVAKLKSSHYTKQLYNTDLLHIQKYIFENIKIAPTCKVKVELDKENILKHIEKVDDEKEIFPPPFKTLYFEIEVEDLNPNYGINPIKSIKARVGDKNKTFEGEEEHIIDEFSNFVEENDPDIIVCPGCDNFTYPHLYGRAKAINAKIRIGRENLDNKRNRKPYWAKGRIVLDNNIYGTGFEDFGVCGLVERSRFSLLPPTIAGRWTANRINDSRVCFELINRDYVIPEKKGNFEYYRTMKELVERDMGAIILPPKIGLHENVAELDFESQFPNIIVKYGVSYENIEPNKIEYREDAILPHVTKTVLERRLYFKRLRKSYPKESIEYKYCEQRQSSLKMILVTLYGTSGCCWNRYGNVLAFEEINKISRNIMLESKNHAQKRGFEIVYADCDSLFVKKDNASKEEYENLAKEISQLTGMPIALDHHYKFLALLPLKSDKNMEAQKHYYGITYDGEIVARGIELRRHDTPNLIKELQTKMIKALFDCKSIEEVYTIGYSRALKIIEETIKNMTENKIPEKDLILSKTLRKPIQEYKSTPPHVAAAIQIIGKGGKVNTGDTIRFVYTDKDHHNPLCRVRILDQNRKINFDRHKYINMILDTAETTLSIFGFSKQYYQIESKKF